MVYISHLGINECCLRQDWVYGQSSVKCSLCGNPKRTSENSLFIVEAIEQGEVIGYVFDETGTLPALTFDANKAKKYSSKEILDVITKLDDYAICMVWST